jgi:ribose/xylose/arabinose/galactoside ABC-type transport system permease subunit
VSTYRFFSPTLLGRLGVLLVVWLAFTLTSPGYGTFNNLYSMIEGFALVGLVAAGLAATMIVGELDLSVGSVAAVAGIFAVQTSSLGLVGSVAVAVVGAVIFGIIQGLIIAKTGINSLVLTIATLIGIRGVAFALTEQAKLLPFERFDMSDAVIQRMWIFSPFSITTIVVITVLGLFLAFTRWGREMYAFGGGRDEARAAGISMTRPVVIAFAVSAGCAGLAGALASLKSGSAAPFAYEPLLLSGVTAALVGGISLYGGRGTMFGVAVGVLILRFLISGLASQGAPTYVEALATGILLLVVLVIEFLTESPQMAEWKQRRQMARAIRARTAVPA